MTFCRLDWDSTDFRVDTIQRGEITGLGFFVVACFCSYIVGEKIGLGQK